MTLKTKNAMKGVTRNLLGTAAFSIAASLPWASPGIAEGLNATFTLGQRLEYTNRTGVSTTEGEGLRTRTTLGIAVTSETRNQRLAFSVNTGLSYRFSNSGGGKRSELQDPSAKLSYKIENRNSELSFNGSYRRADIDNSPFIDPVTGADVETGDGSRETYNFGTKAVFGREGPLTVTLNHNYGEINYSGTTDPSLVDTTTQSLGARVSFEINPTLTVNTFANWAERDAAGPGSNDRTTTNAGVGLSYDISPLLRATARLSYRTIETDNNAGGVTNSNGLGYSFGLTRKAHNGTLTFNFSEGETVNGKQRELSVGRSYVLKRGSLGFSLGVTKTDGLSAQPIASLNAKLKIDKLSTFSASLNQSSTVGNDNLTTINSRLSLNYARELSALSSMSAGLQVTDKNVRSAGGQDQTSLRVSLEHSYRLGGDWNLVSGYSHSTTKRDTQADRKTSSLYMGLRKTFSFRP